MEAKAVHLHEAYHSSGVQEKFWLSKNFTWEMSKTLIRAVIPTYIVQFPFNTIIIYVLLDTTWDNTDALLW